MQRSTITPQQHLQATFAAARPDAVAIFAKPGETQGAAVKRYASARKRAWSAGERRTFPRWLPGESVADYARAYYAANDIGTPSHLTLSDAPQDLHDDTPTVEYLDTITIDAGAMMDAARLAAADCVAQQFAGV